MISTIFLSTLSLRRATNVNRNGLQKSYISIHALLAESDVIRRPPAFLPHQFLSTLSLRRATRFFGFLRPCLGDFYPRSPCGERLDFGERFECRAGISIHALLAESDWWPCTLRRAVASISIHALLAESDTHANRYYVGLHLISIHALLAESDLNSDRNRRCGWRFLSTLSLRRATDIDLTEFNRAVKHFYPRSPCGERPYYMQWDITDTVISIHALLAESDPTPCPSRGRCHNFYPRSPCGERHPEPD